MGWWIALNIVLYIAAAVTQFVFGLWIAALILVIAAALLTLILSGGTINVFDVFD